MLTLKSNRRWFLLPAKRISYCLVLAVLVIAMNPLPVQAAAACSGSITPTTVEPTMNEEFTVRVTSTGSDPIQWIEISVAPGLEYAGNSISGWQTSDFATGVRVFGGWLSSGQSVNFAVSATAGLTTGTTSWTVRASAALNGSSPATCTGTLTTTVEGSPPQENNSVSNVSVSSITSSSARVTWQTDFDSSSYVYYGKTTSYGSQAYSSSMVTSHSVTLSGLSAKTTYHFQVASADGGGTFAYSTDNTFTTAAAAATPQTPSTPKPTTTTKTTTTAPAASIVRPTAVAQPKSKPPTVSLQTLAPAYSSGPTITGEAQDDVGVQTVLYSADGGKNWLPVDALAGGGGKKVTFSFRPIVPLEANYTIIAAAFDTEGQEARSAARTLVIDKMPPKVLGASAMLGSQSVSPDSKGILHAAVGVDQGIALEVAGGATSVVIRAVRPGVENTEQSFTLVRLANSNLWSGALGFQEPGVYSLTADAADGAKNRTLKELTQIVVNEPSRTLDAKSKQPIVADLEVMYRNPETDKWEMWNAAAYDQPNPIQTTDKGVYGLYVPTGTYYLRISAKNYRTVTTRSFTVSAPTVISQTIEMSKKRGFSIGSLRINFPSLELLPVGAELEAPAQAIKEQKRLKTLPVFAKQRIDGATIQTTQLYGKPTVLIFVSSWAPLARDQLAILNSLKNEGINVVAVMAGDSVAKAQSFAANAGYDMPVISDGNAIFATDFNAVFLPTMYIADRSGNVRAVEQRILSKEELQKIISSL